MTIRRLLVARPSNEPITKAWVSGNRITFYRSICMSFVNSLAAMLGFESSDTLKVLAMMALETVSCMACPTILTTRYP